MPNRTQLNTVSYRKDSYIVAQGRNTAECFFIVMQGHVRISRRVDIAGIADEVLAPGDFFGVISTMSSQKHIEDAFALTDVTLIAVSLDQYVTLIRNNTPVAIKILTQLSGQLRLLDGALASITAKQDVNDNTIEGTSRLFNAAEYYLQQKRYEHAFYAYNKYIKYGPEGEDRTVAGYRLEKISMEAKGLKLREFPKGETNRSYQKGEALFIEGQPGRELYVIQNGSIEVSKIEGDKEVLLGTLRAGDILGEMALLENKARTASAIVTEDCNVMIIKKNNFEILIKEQPELVAKITTLLANRVWFIFKQLENSLMINPIGRIYGALFVQLEKAHLSPEATHAHFFAITWNDLVNMLGLGEKEGYVLMGSVLRDQNIQIKKDSSIHIGSIRDLALRAESYRKMDGIEKSAKSGNHHIKRD